jgi:hypothetical protein
MYVWLGYEWTWIDYSFDDGYNRKIDVERCGE